MTGWISALVATAVIVYILLGGTKHTQLLVTTHQHFCIVQARSTIGHTTHPNGTVGI